MAAADSDRRVLSTAILSAGAMIAAQVAGRATRDTLFLTAFDISLLPVMVAAAAVVSVLAVVGVSRAMARYGPGRLVPRVFLVSAVLFAAEWILSFSFRRPIAIAVYAHVVVFGAILVSGFFSLINERFDPHTAKRVMGKIQFGATVGGVCGGVVAERVASLVRLEAMLAVLAGANLLCFFGTKYLASTGTPRKQPSTDEVSSAGAQAIWKSQYLRDLALLAGTISMTSSFLDYLLRAEASAVYPDEKTMLRFFAVFYTGTSILTVIVQSVLGQRALNRLGLSRTVAILPGVIGLGGLGSLFFAPVWRAVVLRATDLVLSNSLYRSGYELFYTPLARSKKRSTKPIIDVGVDRMGQIVGSAIILAVGWFLAPATVGFVLVLAAVAASFGALVLTRRLDRGYVRALEKSLQSRSFDLDTEEDDLDATTRTVWQSSVSISRSKVLEAIAAAEAREAGRDEPVTRDAADEDDELVSSIAGIRSGDPARIRSVLAAGAELDPNLVSFVIPLLADRDLFADAIRALRRVSTVASGELVDALLDPGRDFAIRRRLPRVLQTSSAQRAVDGLLAGLDDRRFDVRYHCARALVIQTDMHPELYVSAKLVFAAARREVKAGKSVWDSERLLDTPEDDADEQFLTELARRSSRSLEHVFSILSLALDREPLRLAYRALESGDRALHGTALEYLENVLPADLRRQLWPHLGRQPEAATRERPRQQIVNDLLKSNASIEIDLAEIRRHLGDRPASDSVDISIDDSGED